jgi:hypothetical protein
MTGGDGPDEYTELEGFRPAIYVGNDGINWNATFTDVTK